MKLVFLVGLLLAVVFAGEADEKSLAKLLAAAPPGVGCRAVPADPSKDVLQLEKKIGDFLKKSFAPYHPKPQPLAKAKPAVFNKPTTRGAPQKPAEKKEVKAAVLPATATTVKA